MFTRVKMGAEEEIHRRLFPSAVRTGKGNKRKNAYAARKSRKRSVILSGDQYCCIQPQKLTILAIRS